MPSITSGNFTIADTPIQGVKTIDIRKFPDERGFFAEAYKHSDFERVGIGEMFVQENQSCSLYGVLRGLHYQKHHPQAKLVRVLYGRVFDVAVDLRAESPSFGRWHGEILSDQNCRQLYIPHGCAHGILILSHKAVFSYKSDDVYHPEDEAGIIWNDETIAIDWPLPESEIITSKKDRLLPSFLEAF